MNRDDYFKDIRKDYRNGKLDEQSLLSDPFAQFQEWFNAAIAAQLVEPNACAVATCGTDYFPSVRMVLLKALDPRGFVFFTNYASKKGQQIDANPNAALLFYWAEFERQVRIEGRVEKISDAESDTYFSSRPRDAQLGAIVSKQSRPVASRGELEQAIELFSDQQSEAQLKRPSYWGGYRVVPRSFEFWQGRENRLHDRVTYTLQESGWRLDRLWP